MPKAKNVPTDAQTVDSNALAAQTDTTDVPTSAPAPVPVPVPVPAITGPIIILEPVMKDLIIVRVDRVTTADTDFIAITAREGSKIIPITCSIAKFEKMGIAAILPIGLVEPVPAMVGLSEIPNDGAQYGYKTKSGETFAYERQGRYQLSNIYSVNNPLNNAFKALYGKTWDPDTATADEHAFYSTMILQKLGR